jgi:hypothetical protein
MGFQNFHKECWFVEKEALKFSKKKILANHVAVFLKKCVRRPILLAVFSGNSKPHLASTQDLLRLDFQDFVSHHVGQRGTEFHRAD